MWVKVALQGFYQALFVPAHPLWGGPFTGYQSNQLYCSWATERRTQDFRETGSTLDPKS